MKKTYKFLLFVFIFLLVLTAGWGVYRQVYRYSIKKDIDTTLVDKSVFRPYIIGEKITFDRQGNSDDFVNVSDGWGGQEDEYRCTVGKNTVTRLYIPKSSGKRLRLEVDATGVYNPKTSAYQEVTIFANDKKLGIWKVSGNGLYTIDIPGSIITDNTLTLRFNAADPYTPLSSGRRLGIVVNEMEIKRVYGWRIKQKIGRWIKYDLMGGGIKQEYDTSISEDNMLL